MFEMVKTLGDYVGKYVRLQIVVPDPSGSQHSIAWLGRIKTIHNDSRIMLFEHAKVDQERMGVTDSELNLEAAIVWAIDIMDADWEKRQIAKIPKNVLAKMPCPKCGHEIYLLDTRNAKPKTPEELLAEQEEEEEEEEG